MIDEIIAFSRAYINSVKERTPERKKKIQIVYKQLTGKDVRKRCGTCYIEALLIINKIKKMGPCSYLLKEGRVIKAKGDYSKNLSNHNITNELAEWHLRINPGCRIHFLKTPDMMPSDLRGFKIIPPKIADEPKVEEVTVTEEAVTDTVVDTVVDTVKLPGTKPKSRSPKTKK
jgi:hypothetical protein